MQSSVTYLISSAQTVPSIANKNTGVFVNTDMRILSIKGDNNAIINLLDGQSTVSVKADNQDRLLRRGVFCNRMGRVVADAVIVNYKVNDEPSWYLLVSQALQQPLLDHLKPFTMLARLQIEALGSVQCRLLLSDKERHSVPVIQEWTWTNDDDWPICQPLTDSYSCLWQLQPADDTAADTPESNTRESSPEQLQRWRILDMATEVPRHYESEAFTAHELGLHRVGCIDFDKGCYLGQEIIARQHVIGKDKVKRLPHYATDIAQDSQSDSQSIRRSTVLDEITDADGTRHSLTLQPTTK